MLVNIIQNTISSFISAGVAAAEVITTNLKMWLGFETSVANQEQVVNGDFSDGTSDWREDGSSSISVGTYEGKTDVANINILNTSNGSRIEQAFDYVNGQTYQVSVDVYLVNGSFRVDSRDSFVADDFVSTTTTGDWQTLTATITAIQTGTDVIWLRSDDEVSQFYVNSISIKELTQITPDKSGNNNVGELFTGKALEFDGSTSYVSANSFAGTLSNNTAFTFAIWFNSDKTLPARFFGNILISSGGGASQSTNIFKIGVNPITSIDNTRNPGGIYFDDSNGYNNVVPSSGGVNYNDGEWHRLVVSRPQGSGSQNLTFYVDGSSIGTAPCNPLWSNMSVFDFGQEWDPDGSGFKTSDHFEGMMSDIQVYDYAWTSDDVTYDYANPNKLAIDNPSTSLSVTNLKGYWALSEGDGSLVYDSSGEGNNGTINGATYEPAQPRIPQLGMMNWSKGSNLLTYSEDFSEWVNSANIAITPNYGTSPIGTQDASRVVFTGSSQQINLIFTTTTNLTASIYMKGSGTIKFGMNTAEEVKTLSASWQRFIVSTSGGGSYITFNTYGGQTARDIQVWGAQVEVGTSAGNYRLTDGAATLNSTVIPNPTIPTQDIFGNAVRDRLNSFNLDGTGYAEVADNTDLDLGTGDFSVEAWVRFEFESQGSSLNTIYSNGEEVNDTNTFSLVSDQNNKIGFYVNGTSCFSTSTFSKDDWVHVVGTRIQGTNGVKLYINGNTTPEATTTNNNTVTNSFDKTIGYDTHSSRYYNNIISDVRVYSQALTSDEVENNYNAGLSAHTN